MPLELVRDWMREYRPSPLFRSPDEREFLPAALEIIEKPASPAGRVVAVTICLGLLIALVWATFGKIDIIATAQGQVMAVGNTKAIQPMEIGIVKAIHVADGDLVHKGQILVELDPTQAGADKQRYSDELRRAELELSKQQGLWAAIQNRKGPKLIAVSTDAPETEVLAAQSSMVSEYNNQRETLADLDQQMAEKAAEIAGAKSSIEKSQASLPFVQQQADLRSDLMKIQFSNKLAYLQAEQTLVEQQHQLVVLGSERDQAVAERMALVQKRKESQSNYEKTVLDDLAKSEAQVAELKAGKVKSAQELDAKTLRAPIDGTIQQLAIHTVGGVATPAQTLMMVVPRDGGLLVQAKVSNHDVGFVHSGQTAEVKVDTFSFTRYGLISGIVTSVSRDSVTPDGRQSEKTGEAESDKPAPTEASYIAYVRLSKNWIDTENGRTSLGPGMTVTTEIHTGRRRIIDYLLSPLQRKVSESLHER